MVNKDAIPEVFEDSYVHVDGKLYYHPGWGIKPAGKSTIGMRRSKSEAVERAQELAFVEQRVYYIVFSYKSGGGEYSTSPLRVIYPSDWMLERR